MKKRMSKMFDNQKSLTAIAAIRVSTTKQGVDGDSPEAQKEQIERFAASRNIQIKKVFKFLESASKEKQPMQAAIDYCKDPKRKIDLLIVKSIDRFTRGGSYSYSFLKMQLEHYNVRLIDLYGIIGGQKVNTLEHLGVTYNWSVYDPTKNSEILEAERASDEKRDIMTRMIGAQIRYARFGYWTRRPPYGYTSQRIDTRHGKRSILIPHPTEARIVVKMYELRCRGTMQDEQIVDSVNKIGYRSRVSLVRSMQDRSKIIAEKGGQKLTLKQLQRMIRNPIYAGIVCEVWTNRKPVKGMFRGLVTAEVFNRANQGDLTIVENSYEIELTTKPLKYGSVSYATKALNYPYRRIVMCPICNLPLGGSASRGKNRKYYPAYHCSRQGNHYFRVSQPNFDKTIASFMRSLHVKTEYVEKIVEKVADIWNARQVELKNDEASRNLVIDELKSQAKLTAHNMIFLRSEVAMKYAEDDLLKIEDEISVMNTENVQAVANNVQRLDAVVFHAQRMLEHLDDLLILNVDNEAKSRLFGLLFTKPPTYNDLVLSLGGTEHMPKLHHMFQNNITQ